MDALIINLLFDFFIHIWYYFCTGHSDIRTGGRHTEIIEANINDNNNNNDNNNSNNGME